MRLPIIVECHIVTQAISKFHRPKKKKSKISLNLFSPEITNILKI